MGKTAKKTASWRTLMRRAETAAPAEAKRLRDRAAAMRRDERKAAAAPKRKVRKVARKLPKAKKVPVGILKKLNIKQAQRDTNKLMGSMLTNGQPDSGWTATGGVPLKQEARHFGANEAVPAGMSQEMAAVSRDERRAKEKAEQLAIHVRAILVEARKKKQNPEKAITERIRNMIGIAVHEASEQEAKVNRERSRNQRNAHTAQVVRSFLASMESYEMHHVGGIPPVVTMSGYTIARIIDALHAAGWSSEETPNAFYERN